MPPSFPCRPSPFSLLCSPSLNSMFLLPQRDSSRCRSSFLARSAALHPRALAGPPSSAKTQAAPWPPNPCLASDLTWDAIQCPDPHLLRALHRLKLTRLASPALLRPLHRAAARDRAPRPRALTSPGLASPRPSAHLVLPLSRPAAAHRPGQGPLCEATPPAPMTCFGL